MAAAKKKMPTFSKPSAATVSAFETATDGTAQLERRTMFGYPAVFVGGNMLASIFQDRIMVRLAESDRQEAIERLGAKLFEPMKGRPMREYVELATNIVKDPVALRDWIDRGAGFVATLPAKKKAAKKSGAKRTSPKKASPKR